MAKFQAETPGVEQTYARNTNERRTNGSRYDRTAPVLTLSPISYCRGARGDVQKLWAQADTTSAWTQRAGALALLPLRPRTGTQLTNVISPQFDVETLSKCHVLLCKLELELRRDGRSAESDLLGYVDLLVLVARNALAARKGLTLK